MLVKQKQRSSGESSKMSPFPDSGFQITCHLFCHCRNKMLKCSCEILKYSKNHSYYNLNKLNKSL